MSFFIIFWEMGFLFTKFQNHGEGDLEGDIS